MPAVAEREKIKTRKKPIPFSPPEWEVIPLTKPTTFDPEIYLRKEVINKHGMPNTITILDEKIIDQGGGTELIIQWILGHHPQLLTLAYEHQGWQGPEMIRKIYRQKIMLNNGQEIFTKQEANISQTKSFTSNQWGRILNP